MTAEKSKKPAVPTFSREQLVQSGRFAGRQDILMALLDGEQSYTMAEAEKQMADYLKGRVV